MSLADYAHHNEEAPRIWWEEEGRHGLGDFDSGDPDDEPDYGAAEAFADECAEMDTGTLLWMLKDNGYRERWPKAIPIIEWELKERRVEA